MPTERIKYGASLGPATTTVTVTWTTPTTITVATADAPSGGWTEAQIDAATVTVSGTSDSDDAKTYELYYDVTYVTQPVVDVTAPTGTLTQNNVATVTWTNTLDSDGGAQAAFEAKIFTAAVATAGGFSPDTSSATETSGVTPSAAATWTGTTRLPDGTYRAYVRTAQSVNGSYHWSAWDYESFTVNVDVPATPTVDVTGDSPNARVAITINEAAATNLLANGSFETTVANWTPVGATVTRSQDVTAKLGSWVAKLVTAGSSIFEGMVSDQATVSSAEAYRAFVWLWVPTGKVMSVYLRELDSGGSVIAQVTQQVTGNNDWQLVSLEHQFTTGVKIDMYIGDFSVQSMTFYVDEARIYQGIYVDKFEVQRSLDAGATWEAARTLEDDGYATPVDETVTLYDYESGNGQTVHFRARAIHDYGSGLIVTSDWSASDSASWSGTDWWLKHPRQPTLNMNLTIDSNPGFQRPARQGVYQPVGASMPIVVTDKRASARGTLRLRLDTEAEQDALEALLETTDTLLIQAPVADRWPDRYVAIGDHDRQRIVDKSWIEPTFDTLPWIEVGQPAGTVDIWPT